MQCDGLKPKRIVWYRCDRARCGGLLGRQHGEYSYSQQHGIASGNVARVMYL